MLDYGFMESAIRSVIITLSRDHNLGHALVPPGASVSHNLDILRRVSLHKTQGNALDEWLSLVDDLSGLFEERNRIFHGLLYEANEQLIASRLKKGNKSRGDHRLEQIIADEHMLSLHKRLCDRRRQMMDFVDDFRSSEEGDIHGASQDVFPSLSFGR